MPMTEQDQRLISAYHTRLRLKRALAEELREEERVVRKAHPDWPLGMVKATARINLDNALRAAKLV